MASRLLSHSQLLRNYCAMNKPLRVLHLEDDPDFSDLVRSLLAQEGIQSEMILVNNQSDYEAALARGEFDVILADYMLPEYDGLEALKVARRQLPETPFLLVSGTIGEQAAIESMKFYVTYYVLKTWTDVWSQEFG